MQVHELNGPAEFTKKLFWEYEAKIDFILAQDDRLDFIRGIGQFLAERQFLTDKQRFWVDRQFVLAQQAYGQRTGHPVNLLDMEYSNLQAVGERLNPKCSGQKIHAWLVKNGYKEGSVPTEKGAAISRIIGSERLGRTVLWHVETLVHLIKNGP